VTLAFGSHMARSSAIEAERFLAFISVKASASAFESFENTTAFCSMIVYFAMRTAIFLIVVFVSSAVSAEISSSMALCISLSFDACHVIHCDCRERIQLTRLRPPSCARFDHHHLVDGP